jgi:ferritin-like metal-binding protein YciE
MAKRADSDELRRAFEHHLKETEGQVERLEQIFGLCGLKPSDKTCPAGTLITYQLGMSDAARLL